MLVPICKYSTFDTAILHEFEPYKSKLEKARFMILECNSSQLMNTVLFYSSQLKHVCLGLNVPYMVYKVHTV